ncbi:MAG: hypothetical protein HY293_02280 [Planctomycetes bacterium]|nr:hypothetical protein [Planctomycetota bacterium]
MARKVEKPSLGKRLTEWAMTAGVLVLVGGLVCAFLVAGVFVLHRSLARNEDENMVVREGASRPAADAKQSALDDLKRPLPPPPKAPPADPKSVAVKPADLAPAKPVEKPKEAPKPVLPPPPPAPVIAAKVPEGPPSRDPSRMDNEGFIRYWLVLAPLPSEREHSGGIEVATDRLRGEGNLRPKAEERVSFRGKDYVWKRYKTPEFFVDFKKYVEGQPSENVFGYAVAYVYCEEPLYNLKVLAGSNDQCRVYVNGLSVLLHEKGRTLERDQSIANGVTLRKGENVVVFKVANDGGNWQGCLRFMDKNGTPIRHLQVSSTPTQ